MQNPRIHFGGSGGFPWEPVCALRQHQPPQLNNYFAYFPGLTLPAGTWLARKWPLVCCRGSHMWLWHLACCKGSGKKKRRIYPPLCRRLRVETREKICICCRVWYCSLTAAKKAIASVDNHQEKYIVADWLLVLETIGQGRATPALRSRLPSKVLNCVFFFFLLLLKFAEQILYILVIQ